MYLINFMVNGEEHDMIIMKRKHDKTIKEFIRKEFCKKRKLYVSNKHYNPTITILSKIPLICKGCRSPLGIDEFNETNSMECRNCYEQSLLPMFYKQLGYKKVKYKLTDL